MDLKPITGAITALAHDADRATTLDAVRKTLTYAGEMFEYARANTMPATTSKTTGHLFWKNTVEVATTSSMPAELRAAYANEAVIGARASERLLTKIGVDDGAKHAGEAAQIMEHGMADGGYHAVWRSTQLPASASLEKSITAIDIELLRIRNAERIDAVVAPLPAAIT